jgi:hypothetical protein
MTDFGLVFHHLGLAVRKPEGALAFVQGMGYTVEPAIFDPLQNVNLIMCSHAQAPAIEIIYRGKSDGPIDALLAKHTNGLIYHCCYVSSNVDKSLEGLSDVGLRAVCVSPSKPAVLFGGASVSFYQIAGVGLIEIIEEAPA